MDIEISMGTLEVMGNLNVMHVVKLDIIQEINHVQPKGEHVLTVDGEVTGQHVVGIEVDGFNGSRNNEKREQPYGYRRETDLLVLSLFGATLYLNKVYSFIHSFKQLKEKSIK